MRGTIADSGERHRGHDKDPGNRTIPPTKKHAVFPAYGTASGNIDEAGEATSMPDRETLPISVHPTRSSASRCPIDGHQFTPGYVGFRDGKTVLIIEIS
jgi:hypothetical protein